MDLFKSSNLVATIQALQRSWEPIYNLCNFVQFGLAIMSIFVLQLWVILFYNKHCSRNWSGRAFCRRIMILKVIRSWCRCSRAMCRLLMRIHRRWSVILDLSRVRICGPGYESLRSGIRSFIVRKYSLWRKFYRWKEIMFRFIYKGTLRWKVWINKLKFDHKRPCKSVLEEL